MGAKRLGRKRPGGNRLWGETTRGGNGLGAKRPGFCDTAVVLAILTAFYLSVQRPQFS